VLYPPWLLRCSGPFHPRRESSGGAARPCGAPKLLDYGMLGQLAGCAWSTRMAALSVPAGRK
jgi:hypothetical protein